MFQRWLRAVLQTAASDSEAARALAGCGDLIKGYGDTRVRTSGQLMQILDQVESNTAVSAEQIAGWRRAALVDDEGQAFRDSLEGSESNGNKVSV